MQRLFQLLALAGTLLGILAVSLFFQKRTVPFAAINSLIAQNTYMGPVQPAPGKRQPVRVEVMVSDSPEAGGVQIQEVEFDGSPIPLKPRDIYGNRGGASFQKEPGTYRLYWRVNRTKSAWPRNTSHEEVVTISPRDLWIQIIIEGEKASIR